MQKRKNIPNHYDSDDGDFDDDKEGGVGKQLLRLARLNVIRLATPNSNNIKEILPCFQNLTR